MYKPIAILLLALQSSSIFTLAAIPVSACDANANSNTNTPASAVQTYSDAVIVNEVLPNPSTDESSEEFIELYNTSSSTVDLTDWQISDATDNTYTLSGSIGSKQYFTIYRSDSALALNNSSDIVELLHPNGQLTDNIEYTEAAKDDVSYALDSNGDWQWTTTQTPGRKNTITAIASATNSTTNTTTNANTNSSTNTNGNVNTNSSVSTAHTLQLSELLPDPEGSDSTDEWIELHNYGSTAVNLQGWQIADSSKTFTISTTTSLNSNGYIVFSIGQTGISLNNSGETISLLDPAQQLTDSVTYGSAAAGQSYAKINTEWLWTSTLTPGEINSGNNQLVASDNTTSLTATNTTDPVTIDAVTIAQAKQTNVGVNVMIIGIVNVLPETFGAQYFYIQDDSGGVQIFSAKKLFPQLAVGDRVQVRGVIGTSNGESKINTGTAEDIIVLDHQAELSPVIARQYNPANTGQLVEIAGTVQDKSGSTITLDSAWEIYIKRNTGVKTSMFPNEETVTVRGIVIANNEGVRVWPRSPEDITSSTATSAGVADAPQTLNDGDTEYAPVIEPTNVTDVPTTWPIVGLLLVGGVVALIAGVHQSDTAKQWLKKNVLTRAQNLVAQLSHWVGLRKNTTDLGDLNQYHESHPLGKKLS